MNIQTIQPYITLIKDIITGFAALVAAVIAIRGYDAWKKQMTANAEHGLARRVLVAVYKVRDAIENSRLAAWEGDDEIVDITKRIHESMLEKLDEAHANLKVELLEAEAVWGSEADYRRCMVLFQAMVQVIKGAYSTYYYRFTSSLAEKDEAYAILFTKSGYPKDEYAIQIDGTITGVENFLRPKLTLKPIKKRYR